MAGRAGGPTGVEGPGDDLDDPSTRRPLPAGR